MAIDIPEDIRKVAQKLYDELHASSFRCREDEIRMDLEEIGAAILAERRRAWLAAENAFFVGDREGRYATILDDMERDIMNGATVEG